MSARVEAVIMLTKPNDVFMCRVRILEGPTEGVSVETSSEFLTAKPTPCCLGLSWDKPCQKELSVSLRDPLSGRLVS